jgi:hypothetical protein
MYRERTRRIPLRIAVRILPPKGRPFNGWARDVSVSGIYVETREQLPVGTDCAMTLSLKEGKETREVQCGATVTRTDALGIAFRFSAAPPDLIGEIARQVVWGAVPARSGRNLD